MSRHPSTKWSQRSDRVYITIELPDAKDVKLSLQPEGRFQFSSTSGPDNILYEIDFELFDKVNVDESKAAVGSRTICYLIKKAENKFWTRLLKQEGKPPVYLKVDWDKWIDEDDEEDNKFGGEFDSGDDMEFSKLNMSDPDNEPDYDLADTADEPAAGNDTVESKSESSSLEEAKPKEDVKLEPKSVSLEEDEPEEDKKLELESVSLEEAEPEEDVKLEPESASPEEAEPEEDVKLEPESASPEEAEPEEDVKLEPESAPLEEAKPEEA